MTTAFPPNKPAINPTSGADLDILTLLISKNQTGVRSDHSAELSPWRSKRPVRRR